MTDPKKPYEQDKDKNQTQKTGQQPERKPDEHRGGQTPTSQPQPGRMPNEPRRS
jgi:hypothetical protein